MKANTQTPRPPPPQAVTGLQQPSVQKDHEMVESVKIKPPSILGTTNQKKHRSNMSSGDEKLARSNSNGSSMRSVHSTGTLSSSNHSSAAERSVQEHAAMQQLAFLVVQLRGDLREAKAAKEEAEEKLKQAHEQTRMASASASVMSAGEASKVRRLQQENTDLQSDIDVFIAEQEDLQKEIERLKEEKMAANDVIKRLKKESMGSSSTSLGGSSAAFSASLEAKNEELDSRVQELIDENHKLEKQIQLLVCEKQSFISRDMEIATLKKSIQEKASQFETTIAELQDQMSALETAKNEFEKVANEEKMNVALVEDQLEAREKEFEMEGKKMTLVRQRLSQVEKQKEGLMLKNESLEQLIASMKEQEAVGTADKSSNEKVVLELEEKISSMEQAKSQLEDDLIAMKSQAKTDAIKLAELESKLNVLRELSDYEGEEAELKARIADLTIANEGMKHHIKELEVEQEDLSDEMENIKNESSRTINYLEVTLKAKQNSLESVRTSKSNLESQQQVSVEQMTSLAQKISELEDAKEKLEIELAEASDAIAMLEDELDSKDIQMKEALDGTTNIQQQFSTMDTQNSNLAERNEILTKENEELNRQVKVLILEKKMANEEIEVLKKSRVAEAAGVETTSKLKEDLSRLEETNQKLVEELEESADAILMLKDALAELEDARADSDVRIEAIEAELERKETALKTAAASSSQLQSEHQVNIDTISALQKMIQSLEKSKEELEDELNQSTMALHEVKEDIRTKDSVILVKELESKLADAEKKNVELSGRIAELVSANKNFENKVKDLGQSVFSITRRCSADREATCDALILELKNQITELVTERNAALEKVAALKKEDSSAGIKELSVQNQASPKLSNAIKPAEPTGEKVHSGSVASALSNPSQAERPKSSQSVEISTRGSLQSLPTRGSSLLEAAKKLCNKLDVQRGIINNEYESEKQDQDDISNEEDEDDDASSAREHKMDPVASTPVKSQVDNTNATKATEKNRSARSQRKYDIDQLTSIYLEKCESEGDASKLSDLTSEGLSARKEGITTKKVKICRNGVFMGTYEGDLNQNGQRHGFGVLICDNGNSYEGEWKKDKRDGLGIARYSSGDVYDGEWLRGKRQGHGVMYIEAGDTYIGSWNNGVKHGAGTYHWADGEVDVSWYQEDRRIGEGVRWNSTRSKAYRLVRGTMKEEISLDEAYNTAEKLGLNLERVDPSDPSDSS
ncbi:hypothetical protein ACHAXM_004017 [Skeletonema potamos]